MTTDGIHIQGDYTDLKFVKGRAVAVICIEIALERADDFVKGFGTPVPSKGVPVVLARLAPSPLKEALKASVELEKKKEPREWSTLKRSQQAGIACSDPGFWQHLNTRYGTIVSSDQDAATVVRRLCGVNTRSDFDSYTSAADSWDRIYSEYQLERRGAIA